MSIGDLLSRLDKVKARGRGRWIACCPAHNDHTPSLALCELDDGRVLLHCFAGCSVHEIVSSVGLEVTDLFPPQAIPEGKGKSERRPFPAADILRCIAFEVLVVWMTAKSLQTGPLSDTDGARLILAVLRIHEALAAGGISDVR